MLQARNEHSLHSPFVFTLYTSVIRSKKDKASLDKVERLRRQLTKSREILEVVDLGAGSRLKPVRSRTVGEIARSSAKPVKYAQLLYRLAAYFQVKTVFDLGTSLGLTTAYLAKAVANQDGQVITFEGCPNTAKLAKANLQKLACSNVKQVVGNLDNTLTEQIALVKHLDLIFFDANHRYAPTIQYFTACLDKIHNDSVFIFDDIHWSSEMERAWSDIQAHPLVTVTIDLFGVGLVFFRKEQPKQHFVLRF